MKLIREKCINISSGKNLFHYIHTKYLLELKKAKKILLISTDVIQIILLKSLQILQ